MVRTKKFPIVDFLDGQTKLIVPQLLRLQIPGKGSCLRVQIPLRLAWALTVHKLQGMELDCCIFDMSSVVCNGMGYTGFSLVKSLKGLQIIGCNPELVRADRLVMEFDEAIALGGDAIDKFLERTGLWSYPLLNFLPLVEKICSPDKSGKYRSMECRQFATWVRTFGPMDG